tara:strand:+ start:169 stop:783 length:615 start_codon:yes stop_codon:yes gene_type:complete
MAEAGIEFDASGFENVQVSFMRGSKSVSADVKYVLNPPTVDTDRALSSGGEGEEPREMLCPGCSDQEVALKMCHGCILADHIKRTCPTRTPPVPRGLQGVFAAEKMIGLLDNERNVFIGRRAPRGVATKSIGVKRTMHASRYANPFVVAKKGFLLGESLSLYQSYVDGGFAPLSEAQLQQGVNTAQRMPETLEEMLALRPELFG